MNLIAQESTDFPPEDISEDLRPISFNMAPLFKVNKKKKPEAMPIVDF